MAALEYCEPLTKAKIINKSSLEELKPTFLNLCCRATIINVLHNFYDDEITDGTPDNELGDLYKKKPGTFAPGFKNY